MKRWCLLFILIFVAFKCSEDNGLITDDFRQDLASENNRVWGDLLRYEFNYNLSELTYERYLIYLDSTLFSSAEGLVDIINNSDSHLLRSSEETFWVLFYYKDAGKIICDNASTDIGVPDTTIEYSNTNTYPDLELIANELIK